MNTKDYKAVDPATTLSLEALRKASEGALKVYDFLPLHPKVVLYLLDILEAAKLDAARYQWLAVQHWVEPEATFRLGLEGVEFINTYRFQLDSAIDAAMAATKGEQA